MKIRRRLGVSPGPVALNGPLIVSVWTCGRPVQSSVSDALLRNGRSRAASVDGELLDERSDDIVRAGPDRMRTLKARIDRVGRVGWLLERGAEVVVAADRRVMHPLAVHRDFDLVRVLDAAQVVEVGPIQPGLNDVLAVERKEVA